MIAACRGVVAFIGLHGGEALLEQVVLVLLHQVHQLFQGRRGQRGLHVVEQVLLNDAVELAVRADFRVFLVLQALSLAHVEHLDTLGVEHAHVSAGALDHDGPVRRDGIQVVLREEPLLVRKVILVPAFAHEPQTVALVEGLVGFLHAVQHLFEGRAAHEIYVDAGLYVVQEMHVGVVEPGQQQLSAAVHVLAGAVVMGRDVFLRALLAAYVGEILARDHGSLRSGLFAVHGRDVGVSDEQ